MQLALRAFASTVTGNAKKLTALNPPSPGWSVGDLVIGPGVPSNTTVASMSGGNIFLNNDIVGTQVNALFTAYSSTATLANSGWNAAAPDGTGPGVLASGLGTPALISSCNVGARTFTLSSAATASSTIIFSTNYWQDSLSLFIAQDAAGLWLYDGQLTRSPSASAVQGVAMNTNAGEIRTLSYTDTRNTNSLLFSLQGNGTAGTGSSNWTMSDLDVTGTNAIVSMSDATSNTLLEVDASRIHSGWNPTVGFVETGSTSGNRFTVTNWYVQLSASYSSSIAAGAQSSVSTTTLLTGVKPGDTVTGSFKGMVSGTPAMSCAAGSAPPTPCPTRCSTRPADR